ncbi:type VII secretion protein EssA [Staphylococcus xylosus]|uniref:type VII secretion protein EssA n=1 Tax=Staphylococcus arlettae TaxID=29378 RepID=UPI000D19B5FE|nr:type VII secretion protein EssA [Staphylococcus arlettae]PUZ32529.1 type VII secretion protein EssA [Staphylococcus arlettae]
MLMEGLLTLTLLTADNQQGSLDIDVQKEEKETINKDLDQYDTTLFDNDSKAVNDSIKDKQQAKDKKIKKELFHDQTGQSTRLDQTKNRLFSSTKEPQNGSESDKRPYIQNKQQQNIIPYILLGIGAFITIGFVIFSISRGRRRHK